jgi:hypothetical protein
VPKNHVGRGPTDSREADLSPDVDASEPQTVAEDGLGRPTSEERAEDKQSDDAGAAAEKQSEEPVVEEKQDDKPSYDGMSLAELRAEADKRQLPSHGNKSQLIERLREADAS